MTPTKYADLAVKAVEKDAKRLYRVFPYAVVSAHRHDPFAICVRLDMLYMGNKLQYKAVLDSRMAALDPPYVKSMIDEMVRYVAKELSA